MQSLHGQLRRQLQVAAERTEVGREQQLYLRIVERLVGRGIGTLPFSVQFGHQRGLVDLYPFRALCREPRQQFHVGRQQSRQQIEAIRPILGLSQPQIGYRTDDDGSRLHAEPARLLPLTEQTRGIQRECRRRAELRHDVVIVGVEPLRHFTGLYAAAARRMIVGGLRRSAARHAEIIVERVAVKLADALGHIAEHEAHVEHLVVEREVADRHEIERRLRRPVSCAQ